MRFSLAGVGDLEVTPGATLAECRPAIDALLGPAAGASLWVAGRELAPHQVAGLEPWVAGSHVEVGPGVGAGPTAGAGDPERAAACPWHLAVTSGPDAGAVAAPGPGGELVVGRGGQQAARASRQDAARLALCDAAVSRTHARLAGTRRGVVVRDAGSANATWYRRRRRWARTGAWVGRRAVRRPGRWRRVRGAVRLSPGDLVRVGDTTLEVRSGDDERTDPDRGTPPAAPASLEDPGARAGRVAAALVPAVLAGAMALWLRSPVLWLMAAAGPLVTLAPQVARRAAGPRRRSPEPPVLGPDAAALAVQAARGRAAPPPWWDLAREGLVVTGGARACAAAGRWLAAGALLDPDVVVALLVGQAERERWRWVRWLAGADERHPARVAWSDGPVPSGARLVVAHAPWSADLDRWWLARGAQDAGERAVVVLAPAGAARPAWCRWVITVADDGAARLAGPDGVREVPAPAATPAWAEAFARRLAARDQARTVARALPRRVGPGDVGLPRDVAGVLATWHDAGRGARPGLRVPIGQAAGPDGVGPAWLDLTCDGPHALVAGTTGAGKSELLQALLLGLALRHPPSDVAFVLLDFKGGTGLRACAGLPHVVGQVSDLDPEQAVRALEALGTELRRREALLAAAGAADLAELRASRGAPPPPRLLVVVDEFAALAHDLPDFVPSLVRLAAQGRSLGMHLVLATQRPAGAVTAQMRANLALRICLRVTDPGESTDVVEVPDAAALPADVPGRAVVRRADGAPQVVQTTWVALAGGPRPLVRRAPDWGAAAPEVPDPAGAERLAALAREAATRAGARPAPLWSPPLPAVLAEHDLAEVADRCPDGTLLLGVTDPAGGGPRGPLAWDGRGVLVVAGAAGSGRTTAAARTAVAALAAGRVVHAVGPVAGLLPADHPALGTVVDAADPRRLARLLALLADGTDAGGLLVVDDLAAAVAALDRMPRAVGADLVERLARGARTRGPALVVTGHPRDVARVAPLADARLVLPVADPADDAALGVPRDLVGRRLPGRAVLVAGGEGVRCHVAPPGAPLPAAPPTPPLRLVPVPRDVVLDDVPSSPATAARRPHGPCPVAIGRGGDDAGPVVVDARCGLLVVGPPGTGRSTALATAAHVLARAGRRVGVVARGGPLAEAARVLGIPRAGTPGAAATLLAGAGVDAVVVDDLDQVVRAAPDLDDRLADRVLAAERGEPGPVVLAACRTDRAAAAYRGVVAALRGTAPVVVLAPAEPGSADVAGVDLAAACEPTSARHPGRGVVVAGGRAVPVQVARPG